MIAFSSLIGALVASAIAVNDIPPLLGEYSVRCDGVSVRHMSWRDQKWVAEEREPNSWIVSTTTDDDCRSPIKKFGLVGSDGEYIRQVCLDIRPVNSEYTPPLMKSEYCTEGYFKNPTGKWITSFSCKKVTGHFIGEIDGEFKRVDIVSFISYSEKAKQNGTTIETGHCRRIDQ